NIGNFLNVGFEKVLLLYNPMTYSTGDVISTYLYRVGLVSNNLSYAGHRPVPGDHRIRDGHVGELHLEAIGGDEPVVIEAMAPDAPRQKPTAARAPKIKDTRSYKVFTVVNTVLLLLMCAVMLYPFIMLLAQSFSSAGAINAGKVN